MPRFGSTGTSAGSASSSSTAGSGRGGPPQPPEFGAFALDHDGDCRAKSQAYTKCIAANGGVVMSECADLAAEYLKCRMQHGLMKEEKDLSRLGLRVTEGEQVGVPAPVSVPAAPTAPVPAVVDRHSRGFLAGTTLRTQEEPKPPKA